MASDSLGIRRVPSVEQITLNRQKKRSRRAAIGKSSNSLFQLVWKPSSKPPLVRDDDLLPADDFSNILLEHFVHALDEPVLDQNDLSGDEMISALVTKMEPCVLIAETKRRLCATKITITHERAYSNYTTHRSLDPRLASTRLGCPPPSAPSTLSISILLHWLLIPRDI